MNRQKKISAVVPIFNEEKTVAGVVKILLASSLLDEVICINDGSSDSSLKILQQFDGKIRLINLKGNHGKGYALAKGVKRATGEIVAFFDGDLVNLSKDHVVTLLRPILNGEKRVVLGFFSPPPPVLLNAFSPLTGERVYYRKDLLPFLHEMAKAKFGVEILLNSKFDKKDCIQADLKDLKGLLKHEKRKPKEALQEYLKEAKEMILEISKREKLRLTDRDLVKQLARVKNYREIFETLGQFQNQKINNFLNKYFKIDKLKKWWEEV